MDLTLIILTVGWIFVAIWIPIVIAANRKTHPKALFILFFAEMWERFSYYGMRALLTLYMVQVLFLGELNAEERALGIYGAYTAMAYLFPIIGGLIADRIFGFRRAILLGGFLMMLGHFALALEGMAFGGSMPLFFGSLGLIIVGNGYFKPNISSFLGTFYTKDDPRKDGAFTIFYMGVNIGAFLATLTCGYVGQQINWHYGFGLAGIGMGLGLIVFWLNQGAFGNKGLPPGVAPEEEEEEELVPTTGGAARLEKQEETQKGINLAGGAREYLSRETQEIAVPSFLGDKRNLLVLAGTLFMIPVCALLLNANAVLSGLLTLAGIGIVVFMFVYGARMGSKVEGQRLWVVGVLFVFHAVFWALFEQAGGSLTLFADKNIDRFVMGTEIPASIFQSFNPFYIIIFAPVFSWMWLRLRNRNAEPSTPMKFVLGLLQLAFGFLIIVLGARYFADSEGLVPIIFLALMYLFHTTGELSLSPVGLSLITKLSPARIVGFVMGAWFLSISLANNMAGLIGQLAAVDGGDAADASRFDTLALYSQTYLTWGVFVVAGAAAILALLVPVLRRWMHGIH